MKNVVFIALLAGVALFAWMVWDKRESSDKKPTTPPTGPTPNPAPKTAADVLLNSNSAAQIQCIAAPCNTGGGTSAVSGVLTPQIVVQPPKQTVLNGSTNAPLFGASKA